GPPDRRRRRRAGRPTRLLLALSTGKTSTVHCGTSGDRLRERPARDRRGLPMNRSYRLLWAGQALSTAGFSGSMIAFPLLVLAVTGSPAVSGLVLGVDAAAQLLAGLP